jgi:hypothetical protein
MVDRSTLRDRSLPYRHGYNITKVQAAQRAAVIEPLFLAMLISAKLLVFADSVAACA